MNRYKQVVPVEVQLLAAEENFGDPEWFCPSGEVAAYYPPSVRNFLQVAAGRLIEAGMPQTAEEAWPGSTNVES